MTDEEKALALKEGRRAPPEWDGDKWERETRKTKASRPYAIADAAHQMAEMCRKAGWTGVVVTELRREPAKKEGSE